MHALRQLIAAHRPHAVTFYGQSYREYWAAIAGATMQPALNVRLPSMLLGACVRRHEAPGDDGRHQ
ncbi:MAG: hypothetical protein KAX65_02160 [Caldilineaceae bacterium]|nr:hypothetical protein [Caldilineaceae bacterium]